jgi:hypothetical protein
MHENNNYMLGTRDVVYNIISDIIRSGTAIWQTEHSLGSSPRLLGYASQQNTFLSAPSHLIVRGDCCFICVSSPWPYSITRVILLPMFPAYTTVALSDGTPGPDKWQVVLAAVKIVQGLLST